MILKRSEQTRARLSRQTIRKASRRSTLRSAFVVELIDALASGYDWLLIELSSGGFGAVQAKALEAAKPVTGKKYLTADERRSIDRGKANYDAFHFEVVGDVEDQIEDE